MRRPVLAIITVLGALLVGERAIARSPFKHQGLDLLRPPDSALPNEQVDPASGTLTVVATDLVLPGNAGLSLAVQRVYNSAVFPDYDTGSTAMRRIRGRGLGGSCIFGASSTPTPRAPARSRSRWATGAGIRCITRWRIPTSGRPQGSGYTTQATHELHLPNGRVYTFGREVTLNGTFGAVRYVTEIKDPFNNRIEFSYFDAPGPLDGVQQIRQHLSATQIPGNQLYLRRDAAEPGIDGLPDAYGGQQFFGSYGDIPRLGDMDGDGKVDLWYGGRAVVCGIG